MILRALTLRSCTFQEVAGLVLCANKDETYCKVYGEIHYCLLIPAVGSGIISLENSKIIAVVHKLKLKKNNNNKKTRITSGYPGIRSFGIHASRRYVVIF